MSNLYISEEWKSLSKTSRSQLLLVIEGLKRGAIIEGNWTSFMDILKKTGLEYNLNTDKYELYPVVVVAKPEDLAEANHRYLTLPERLTGYEHHKITGWLMGYPECCTEEYVKERTPEQRQAKIHGPRYLSYKFGQEMNAQIMAEGSYPEIFDYLGPTFTPCGIECPEAIRILTSWKDAIETLDSEAAKEVVHFSRLGFPQRFAHKDYLEQEAQRTVLEHEMEMLRNCVR